MNRQRLLASSVVLALGCGLLYWAYRSPPPEPVSRQELWYHTGYPGGIGGGKGMSALMGPTKMPQIYQAIVRLELIPKAQLHVDSLPGTPDPAAPIDLESLQQVHTDHFLGALFTGTPPRLAASQGLPRWSRSIARGWLLNVGGFYQATHVALKKNIITGNIGHGYHHALPHRGGEYCTINGLVVVAKKLLRLKQARRVMILDLDHHEGNGTAVSVLGTPSIWNVSIYGEYMDGPPAAPNNHVYWVKHDDVEEGRQRDINYLATIATLLPKLLREQDPDIILFQAGMDPYDGADISEQALELRDAYVFALARSMNKAVTWVLAGGYAKLDTLVRLHTNTIRMANRVLPKVKAGDQVLYSKQDPYEWSYEKGKVHFPDWVAMAREFRGPLYQRQPAFSPPKLAKYLAELRRTYQAQKLPPSKIQAMYRALLAPKKAPH